MEIEQDVKAVQHPRISISHVPHHGELQTDIRFAPFSWLVPEKNEFLIGDNMTVAHFMHIHITMNLGKYLPRLSPLFAFEIKLSIGGKPRPSDFSVQVRIAGYPVEYPFRVLGAKL
jgi:hypothetical protein